MKLQTLIALIALPSLPVLSLAVELPFVGTKTFNLYGGSGTEQSISIRDDGVTTIRLHGTQNSSIAYHGLYQSYIPDGYDTGYYRIDGNEIQWLDSNKQVISGVCRIYGRMDDKCISELYD